MLIDAVVVNYMRPENIPSIIAAFERQTVPVRVILIDAAPNPIEASGYDCYMRLSNNYMAWNRFAATFLSRAEYTYFHDDDMLPGSKCLENFLKYRHLPFGVLGNEGRIWEGNKYGFQQIKATDHPVVVDHMVRGYFVKTENLSHLLRFRHLMSDDSFDDMWMAKSISCQGKLTNYVIPAKDEERMNVEELPDHHGMHQCPRWEERRNNSITEIIRILNPPLLKTDKPLLSIVTPVSRPKNLPTIEASLQSLKPYFEVRWILILDESLVKPDEITVKPSMTLTAPHSTGGQNQRNSAKPYLKEGWVYYLDDDNVIHPDFPVMARHYIDTYDNKCFIFNQMKSDGSPRLETSSIAPFKIDTASFLLHASLTQNAVWRPSPGQKRCVDAMFIKDVWNEYNDEFLFTGKWCTYHNFLRASDPEDERVPIFG